MNESGPWDDHPAYKFYSKQAELQRHAAAHTSDSGHAHRHRLLAEICDDVATRGYLDEPFRIVSADRLAKLEASAKATRPPEIVGWIAALFAVSLGPILWEITSAGMLITLIGIAAIVWFVSARTPLDD